MSLSERSREREVSHEMAAGAHGDVRSRRGPCERGGRDGAGHRAATAPDRDRDSARSGDCGYGADRESCPYGYAVRGRQGEAHANWVTIPLVSRWHGVAREREPLRSERPA